MKTQSDIPFLIEGLKLKPEETMVEPKHGKIGGARLDLKIFKFSGVEYSFEFKYENYHLTSDESRSGQLPARMLQDIFRLATLHEVGNESQQLETVFIYLTAQWGKNYLRNPKNTLTDVLRLWVEPLRSTVRVGRSEIGASRPLPCVPAKVP
jgi:hypothetical protein